MGIFTKGVFLYNCIQEGTENRGSREINPETSVLSILPGLIVQNKTELVFFREINKESLKFFCAYEKVRKIAPA